MLRRLQMPGGICTASSLTNNNQLGPALLLRDQMDRLRVTVHNVTTAAGVGVPAAAVPGLP